MMINNIQYSPIQFQYPSANRVAKSSPSFKGGYVETLKFTNIGSCLEGYIGKVRVRRASDNQECFLNVFKKYIGHNAENYSIKNDKDELVGEIDVFIKKYQPGSYSQFEYKEDPSHVFVDNLRNYSAPDTPYYRQGLEHMKDIGTRLLQIAQRRSDEAQCVGNIKLISKNESKNWYKNVIGMVEEYPITSVSGNSKLFFAIHNPNSMILPPHAKEPLSRLTGGL